MLVEELTDQACAKLSHVHGTKSQHSQDISYAQPVLYIQHKPNENPSKITTFFLY